MAASLGWRLHREGTEMAATLYGSEGDVVTVKGFEGRLEVLLFVALYWVLMFVSRDDKATQLLRDYTTRAKPS